MPRDTNKPTKNTTANPPVAAGTPRYGLRGVQYKYSHSKAPHVPPPKPPKERPALPQSIARKGKNQRTVTQAAPADTGINQVDALVDQDNQVQPEPERLAPEAHNFNPISASASTSISAQAENTPSVLDSIAENASMVTEEISTPGIEASQRLNTAPSTQNTQAHGHISLTMPLGNPLCTPRRSNPSIGFTSPAVVIFQTPPNWARFDQDDSQMPPFVPNTSIPFDTSTFLARSPPALTRYPNSLDSGPSSLAFRATEFADPGSGPALNEQPRNASTLAEDVFRPQPTLTIAAPVQSTNFNTMYTTIMRTIPSILPVAPMTLVPARSSGSAPLRFPSKSSSNITSREGSALPDDLVPAQDLSVSQNTALGLVATREQGSLWHSSVAPSSHRLSRMHLPTPRTRASHPEETQHMMYLRQGDFKYDQVTFIKHMKHRWCLYLAAQDPFPINILPAQELCISYAEQVLQASHAQYNITQEAFDYVRKKDSNIRNSFLSGLLNVVEEGYDVTAASGDKIDELIKNLNFAHNSYDLITKKVKGRYRHHCIGKVISIILFTKRSRGRPVGVRFIRELMGDIGTEPAQDLPSLAANAFAPVATIALACTMILHALHSIKAGDSSNRKPKTIKPVKFAEQKYGGHYRTILAKMKQYSRLGEVQKAYMEEIMKEYLVCHATTGEESDGELEFDDEMMSDGE
ncbi:hypothetical protein FS749_003001 [Ceratobasidium sp. UAMH 11750]|nr:hypothetical protein FS749_003001 [Ceratobasidium sp. UAMH 11750]